jgi:catalase
MTMPLPTDDKLLALSQRILEQFDAVFGLHPGFRPAHAKGMMLSGTFTPSPQAASLTRAPHMMRPSTPVSVRFSDSTAIPVIPDNDPHADPRGCAIRFHLAERSHTDIISHSTDTFLARNGEEFLAFLQAIAASDLTKPSDPANPSPLEKFLGSHPATLAFVQAPKPPPSSFARETYFAVTAYQFINQAGATRFGRYRIVPADGNDRLAPAAAAAKTPDYLFDELRQRVARVPIVFQLIVQLANPGDIVNDATIHWPADRPTLELGTITLTHPVANDAAEQKQIIFDPIPRIDGIEPSADPLLELRAAIYLLSGRRRRAVGV